VRSVPLGKDRTFVLFDLGQTLVDLEGLVIRIGRRLASQFPRIAAEASGISARWIHQTSASLPREVGDRFVREIDVAAQVLGSLLAKAGVSVPPEGAEELLRRAWDDFETDVRLCPGVSRTWLKEIKNLAAGLAIVTDGDSVNVDRLVRRLQLSTFFDAIVTSEFVRSYKPNPRIYEAALTALGAKAGQSIFVSDTALDLRGAAAVGIRTAFLPRNLLSSDPALPPETYVLASPRDLNGILQ
jgi:2-haloacid dehalogenase